MKILCVLAAIAVAGCSIPDSGTVRAAALKPEDKRNTPYNFTLKDSNGQTVKLSDYKGKVVLLNFWATWCGPCKIEIPWFIEFEQQYKDRGFAALGVAMDDEGWEAVKPYITEKRINYRTLLGDEMTAQKYGGLDSLPTTFLLDRQGRVASTHIGLISKGDYKDEIEQLLQAKRSSSRSSAPVLAFAGAK